MAFRIVKKDATIEEAIRRIAEEQIVKAVAAIDEDSPAEAVHDLRKRCKKLRALVRLVRPAFAGSVCPDAEFRDIARLVSGARDAKVMQDTYDLLVSHNAGRIDRRALSSIRRRFTAQRKADAQDEKAGRGLAECRERLLDARARLPDWRLESDGFEALAAGLARTYKRARKAAEQAYVSPNPEAIHRLRKHLKHHWHQTRLLAGIWPDMLDVHASLAKKLTELLGVHHDVSVFAQRLAEDPAAYGAQADVDTAIGLARSYAIRLEHRTAPMTRRLVAQEPNELVHEWRALWTAWRDSD